MLYVGVPSASKYWPASSLAGLAGSASAVDATPRPMAISIAVPARAFRKISAINTCPPQRVMRLARTHGLRANAEGQRTYALACLERGVASLVRITGEERTPSAA